MHTFRVTRNEDLEVEEDDAENLLAALEKELLRRRFGPPVRLEVEESIAPQVLELLVSELGVSDDEVFRLPGPLDLRGLHDIADLPRQELKYPAFLPTTHRRLAEVESAAPVDVFKATRRHDVLLHHPYDSFATSVQRFIEQAAADPHVLAIKQTLYRTSGDSPIIDALIDAAEAGKQVLVHRRDQGALRRAGQHPLGAQARAGRLPRGLRPGRAEDPLQAGDGGARRARRHPPLHPHRHRQLQPEDLADVRGPRADHHRRADRRGRRPPVQQPDRLVAQRVVRRAAGRPRLGAHRADRPDPPRDRPPPGRAARPGSGSRPTRSSTRRSSTRSTSPRRRACRSSCWSAASARCGPACPGCRRRSRCARSSAGSSSTAGCSGSRTAASRSPGSARPT